MQKGLQRLRRLALLFWAPVVLCLPAFAVTTAEAASQHQDVCVLGLLCLPTPAPTPAPTPRPGTPPPAPASPPSTPTKAPVPVAPAPPAAPGGSIPAGVVTAPVSQAASTGGSAPGAAASAAGAAASTAAPGCTVDLFGNCVSLLPGIVGPAQQPVAGSGGVDVTIPLGSMQVPVLSLGQSGCLAALLGTCAASNTPGPGTQQPCQATLLTVCVPTPPGSSVPVPSTCVLNGTVCLSPSPCVGGTCPLGGTPPPPATRPPGTTGPAHPGGSTGSGSAGTGSVVSTQSTASVAPLGLGADTGANGGLNAPTSADVRSTAALGVSVPALPTSNALGWLSGLSLGSLLLWPIFAILDALAAAALFFLARRSWSAAPGD